MRSSLRDAGSSDLPLLADVLQRGHLLRQLRPRALPQGGLVALRQPHQELPRQTPRHVCDEDRSGMDKSGHLCRNRHLCTVGPGLGARIGALQAYFAVYNHDWNVLFADRKDILRAMAYCAGGAKAGASGRDGGDVLRGVGASADDGTGRAAGARAGVVRAVEARSTGAVCLCVGAGQAQTGRSPAEAQRGARLARSVPPRDASGARYVRRRVRGLSRPHAVGACHSVCTFLPCGLSASLPRHDGSVPNLCASLCLLLKEASENLRIVIFF